MSLKTMCACSEEYTIEIKNSLNHPKYVDGSCLAICMNCKQVFDTKLKRVLWEHEVNDRER